MFKLQDVFTEQKIVWSVLKQIIVIDLEFRYNIVQKVSKACDAFTITVKPPYNGPI